MERRNDDGSLGGNRWLELQGQHDFRRACQTPPASLACFTAVLLSAKGYELQSQYYFQYSTWADLLRHFNGLVWHGRDPEACFPTADFYTEVICLDFQLTGNIWSMLLCLLLEKTYEGSSSGRAATAHRGMLKPNDNDSTGLSLGVKVFAPDQKQTSYCNVVYAIRPRRNYCEYKNTDRVMKENIRKQRLWWDAAFNLQIPNSQNQIIQFPQGEINSQLWVTQPVNNWLQKPLQEPACETKAHLQTHMESFTWLAHPGSAKDSQLHLRAFGHDSSCSQRRSANQSVSSEVSHPSSRPPRRRKQLLKNQYRRI